MIGLDVGTMNLVSAKEDSTNNILYSNLRNMFLLINKNDIGTFDISKIMHANMYDDKIAILSDDAFNFANIFNRPVNRPMSNGLINPSEIDAVDVLTIMLTNILKQPINNNNNKCVYSCPAESVDNNNNIVYHREVLKRIITSIGYDAYPLNEAVAIIYSNCQNEDFTGLSFSFGAGMTNVSLVFKAIPIFTFSINRGGDWIDTNSANSVGLISNRITNIKENNLDLQNYKQGNRKESRIREAIVHYYKELITYVITTTIAKIEEHQDIQFPTSLPIIISGGTSKPINFLSFFSSIIANYQDQLSFNISTTRMATDPLRAVAEGCLIKAKTLIV